MKAAEKALIAFVIVSLFSLIPLQGPLHRDMNGERSLLSEAVAASAPNSDSKNNEEPFAQETVTVPDPLEKMNRAFFKFNDKFYFWVVKPGGTLYSAYFPPGVRTCVRNAFTNFAFPIRFINNIFQGKFKGAGIELARFTINSTLGAGGMFEMANKDFNLAPQNEDFGRTLAFYGVNHGFYLVWPLFGPSSGRDTIGLAADSVANPTFWIVPEIWQSTAIKSGQILNNSSLRIGEYEEFKKSAIDPYISMRDAYIQHRAKQGFED